MTINHGRIIGVFLQANTCFRILILTMSYMHVVTCMRLIIYIYRYTMMMDYRMIKVEPSQIHRMWVYMSFNSRLHWYIWIITCLNRPRHHNPWIVFWLIIFSLRLIRRKHYVSANRVIIVSSGGLSIARTKPSPETMLISRRFNPWK